MTQKIPTPQLEKVIVKNIMTALKKAGVKFAFKTHGSSFQGAGLPDIICIAPGSGVFVGLEVKRPVVGKVTALQQATLDKINEVGGKGRVVRSVSEALNHVWSEALCKSPEKNRVWEAYVAAKEAEAAAAAKAAKRKGTRKEVTV